MELNCPQKELNTHLGLVGRAVPGRPPYPVLGNVLLVADVATQQLHLTAFDLSLAMETRFPAQVQEGGALTLPAKLLGEIVAKLPDQPLAFSFEGERMSLQTTGVGASSYQIPTLPASEFPDLPRLVDAQTLVVAKDLFLAGLRGVLFAASGDEAKQILTGVHLTMQDERLEFAATDGHRLAVVETEIEGPAGQSPAGLKLEATIPARALRELERMLQRYGGDALNLHLDPSYADFQFLPPPDAEGMPEASGYQQRLISCVLDGAYPNYRQLIPRDFSRRVVVNRAELVAALERLAILAAQRNNVVKFALDGMSTLRLSVEATDVGRGDEQVAVEMTGDALELAFNVKYILDGLKVMGSDHVQLDLNTPVTPAIWSPLGETKLTYLVMPIQLRS
ncbi:MAG: DNA polymerase III subunit beta [Gloeomargaritaceae cyanobacterium C42_A2020_066]|nr:DNA polymerase III subunit beta [Gloeomargaritaceae cyanobacterium C42_A2020_066]